VVRRYCRKNGLPFTTSLHTRFPDYLSVRAPVPQSWTWAMLRWFHGPSRAVMAATPQLASELRERGFRNVVLWPRGVDIRLFHPRRSISSGRGRCFVRRADRGGKRTLRRISRSSGDGPARPVLEQKYPQAVFLGALQGERLAEAYASADVYVFPSRTDTFGVVLLEALASGPPIAAFPVSGPRDVIGSAPVGVLSEDLREACLAARRIPSAVCIEFAAKQTWEASTGAFIESMADIRNVDAPDEAVDLQPSIRAS